MLKKYQIKGTYTDGKRKGESFILTKGGHIARSGFQLPEFCYLKESAAKMAATKYQKAEDPECPVKYEVIEV